MRLRMSVVVAVVCLLVPVFSAQADRGWITGVITDTGGAVLPGVTVTLAGPEQRSVVSNDRGAFVFDNLAPGRYTLRATLPGFVDLMRNVSVAGAGVVRLTLQMAVGALSETVGVSAEAPIEQRRSAPPPAAAPPSARVPGGMARGVIGGVPAAAAEAYR